jgi:hypothetical protein
MLRILVGHGLAHEDPRGVERAGAVASRRADASELDHVGCAQELGKQPSVIL